MKILQQLADVVSPSKIKGIQLIPFPSSNVTELYESLSKGRFRNQEIIHNPELLIKQGVTEKRFKKIKRSLFYKLIDLLFLIDSNNPKFSEYKIAYTNCYKYASAIKILLSKGARLSAIYLAEKIFKISKYYEFTDVSLSLSNELMMHYGGVTGDKKKYFYYLNKTKDYSSIYQAEIKANSYYSELALQLSHSRASKQEFHELARSYSRELDELINQFHSFRLNFVAFNVMALSDELVGGHEKVIITCERAINYFHSKKYEVPRSIMFTFIFRKIPSLISLQKLDIAAKTSDECLKYISPGYSNWFKILELRLIIFMHSKKFDGAYQVYENVISHKSFTKQFTDTKEIWYIYEAYLYYFYLKNLITVPINARLKKFRVNKFLNEVPNYSKDKRGVNIAILIVQVLFLLHQKAYGKIIDRTEALRTYTHRYLRQDETFRSNCFIKMLMQLPAASFHKVAVLRKTEKLREKLNSVGIINNQSAEVEAVPYEVLWESILDSLDNKIR